MLAALGTAAAQFRGEVFPRGSIRGRLAEGFFWTVLGSAIGQGLTLLASVFVGRMLGSAHYGELGIIQSTLSMFAIFTGSSIGITATKYVSEHKTSEPEKAGRILGLTLVAAAVVSAGLTAVLLGGASELARRVLSAPHLAPQLRLASLILFLNGVNGAQTGALAGLEAFREIARVNLIRGFLSFPLLLLGTRMFGLTGAIVALILLALATFALTHSALSRQVRANDMTVRYDRLFGEWPVLTQFSIPAVLSGVVAVPAAWIVNAMLVNQAGGYSQMGVLNAANQWRLAILFLPGALAQPMLPVLSELYGHGVYGKHRRAVALNMAAVSAFVLAPAVLISLASDRIMSYYGRDFGGGGHILILLLVAAVISAPLSVIGSALASMGKMWQGFAFNSIWAVVLIWAAHANIAAGAKGVALAYVIAYGVHFVLLNGYTWRMLWREVPG
jgi:O-antigen/teichoic acid export membrane protein